MSAEQFRQYGRNVIDWIADYLQHVENHPVQSQAGPGEVRAKLPTEAPMQGEPFENLMRDVDNIIMPGLTHWQSPNFFAFFPANTSGPSILGDLLASGLGVQGMLWATSPACTELETHVLDWLVDMLDLPQHFKSTSQGGSVIQDTASSATLCAMLAARERATNFNTNQHGVNQTLTAYCSNQAHSSVVKAAGIAGIGRENLRELEVDEHFAMRPDALDSMIEQDQQQGRQPFFVTATVGTTSSNAFDPLRAIGEVCRAHNLWLHVDAAMSGTAAMCPDFRWMHDGLEFADSYCFNPHKWMLTNFDCDCFYVADRAMLIQTLSILPEYLKNAATTSGEVFDYRDWHIPLGRRFRALKLWFVIRHYGVEGLQAHVREHVAMAQQFTQWVDQHPDFERVAPTPLTLVCFRHKSSDEFNERLLNTLNSSGKLYMTHTRLNDQYVLRMSIGATLTQRRHVEHAWRLIDETAKRLSDTLEMHH